MKINYRTPDGVEYPLEEATTPFSFKVYRSDRRKATIGDPTCCIIALGLRRHRQVKSAHIGGGKDAYVIFRETSSLPARAVHYVILAHAARVRDAFETKKDLESQIIWLHPPTKGRTLSHRAKLDKRRRAEVKAGAIVKKRTTPRLDRITRIGVPNRPSAHIINKAVEVASAS